MWDPIAILGPTFNQKNCNELDFKEKGSGLKAIVKTFKSISEKRDLIMMSERSRGSGFESRGFYKKMLS